MLFPNFVYYCFVFSSLINDPPPSPPTDFSMSHINAAWQGSSPKDLCLTYWAGIWMDSMSFLSVHLSVHLNISMPIRMFIHPYVWPTVHSFVHLTVCLYISWCADQYSNKWYLIERTSFYLIPVLAVLGLVHGQPRLWALLQAGHLHIGHMFRHTKWYIWSPKPPGRYQLSVFSIVTIHPAISNFHFTGCFFVVCFSSCLMLLWLMVLHLWQLYVPLHQ